MSAARRTSAQGTPFCWPSFRVGTGSDLNVSAVNGKSTDKPWGNLAGGRESEYSHGRPRSRRSLPPADCPGGSEPHESRSDVPPGRGPALAYQARIRTEG